ncbi:MAG: protein arginine kinase [Planctomycetota bacterium]
MLSFDPNHFAERQSSWLQLDGPEVDVVVSCRVRLARNLEGYSFVSRLEPERARELADAVRAAIDASSLAGGALYVPMEGASPLVRMLLQERHLISRDLAAVEDRTGPRPGRAVVFDQDEVLSIMVNEEDHLRLQGISGGFSPRDAWSRVLNADRVLEEALEYSFTERLGYLTACPTNVGTGMRASVMLHLPALGMIPTELQKVIHAAQRTSLAVRGMYGEGSRAVGDFYQISNQITLGCSEERLLTDLEQLVPAIVAFERRVRETVMQREPEKTSDRVSRSLGTLRSARSLTTDVALLHLSNVRLGVCLGMITGVSPLRLNHLAIQIQRGHVHALSGGTPEESLAEPTQRDRMRASFLRRQMASIS